MKEAQNHLPKNDLQRIKALRLLDDEFMTKCFEDNSECTELLLHIILGRDDLTVLNVQTQKNMQNLLGRSVILDIFATDDKGRKYNIEIQRQDKGACVKRARYHSSILDANTSLAGSGYEELPDTYVIFITENDVLGENLSAYHVERQITETGQAFGDGAHIIYVNGALQDQTALGRLMHDFACSNPDDMYYEVLAARTRFFKERTEGNSKMSKIFDEVREESFKMGRLEGIEVGHEAGRLEGVKAGRLENSKTTALRMIKSGRITFEDIAEFSGLTLEAVKMLAKEKATEFSTQ